MAVTYRRYVSSHRYDYWGVDEFDQDGGCIRTVATGLTRKMGDLVASELNAAYEIGRSDALAYVRPESPASMTFDEMANIALSVFPRATIMPDADNEWVIHTDISVSD